METLASKITGQVLAMTAASNPHTKAATCEKHGEYVSSQWRGTWTNCMECIFDQDREREAAERVQWQQELKAREWQAKLGRAAIPERFQSRRLENYVPECKKSREALRVAQNYAETFDEAMSRGTCMLFCGDVGTGKTHLAVGIAHAIMAAGRQAVFTSVMRAVRSVKETYSRGSQKTEAEAIRDLVEPDLLILDEVGVQFGSDAEKLILFEIINGRYESSRPTIVISNLGPKPLEEFLGARSFDRLREGGGKLVVFDWSSYRSKKPLSAEILAVAEAK